MKKDVVDTNWKGRYPSLKEFYDDNYPSEFYDFDSLQYTIDPTETDNDIERYNQARQVIEIKKCALSFNYFAQKYLKIAHPIKGLLPFILYKYQKRVISEYEKNRYVILKKFRQGGQL